MEHTMIVKTVVLLACHSLVSTATEVHDVIQKSLTPTFSRSPRIWNDIITYGPSGEDVLDGEYDLLAHKNAVSCTKSGLQCASDGKTLVECSGTLDAISAWDCYRIFPKHLFMNADAVEVLCDPIQGSCAALIQFTEPEDKHTELEPVGDFFMEAAKQTGYNKETNFPYKNFHLTNEVGDITSKEDDPISKGISKMAANTSSTENITGGTEKLAALQNGSANVNESPIKNNLGIEVVDSPAKTNGHPTVQGDVPRMSGNVSNISTNGSAAKNISESADTVAFLPYVKCKNQGLHCADAATIVDCDNESSEPLFEMSCSSLLQSSEMESDSGKCDDATTSCLLNLGGFPLRMRVFQSDEKIEGVCQDGTLTCADNSTLVACSGDENIPSYAINCAGEESNDAFFSYCDYEQKGCVIQHKDSSYESEITNETVSQNPATTIAPKTTKTKKPSSIVAIPSMFLIPPLIPLSESISNTTEASSTTERFYGLCQDAGWKCANFSTLVLCSSQAEPLVQLNCNTTDHPYCDVMTGRCTLEENTIPQSPCLHPGLQCITNHVLGWCSSSLQVRHITPCEIACNADTHNCQVSTSTAASHSTASTIISSTTTNEQPSTRVILSTVAPPVQLTSSVIPSVASLQQAPPLQPSSSIIPPVQPLLGSCSKPGMQCVGTDMLGSCSMELTLNYVVPCAKLLPYADINSVEVFCDREIDACAISEVLNSYTQ